MIRRVYRRFVRDVVYYNVITKRIFLILMLPVYLPILLGLSTFYGLLEFVSLICRGMWAWCRDWGLCGSYEWDDEEMREN